LRELLVPNIAYVNGPGNSYGFLCIHPPPCEFIDTIPFRIQKPFRKNRSARPVPQKTRSTNNPVRKQTVRNETVPEHNRSANPFRKTTVPQHPFRKQTVPETNLPATHPFRNTNVPRTHRSVKINFVSEPHRGSVFARSSRFCLSLTFVFCLFLLVAWLGGITLGQGKEGNLEIDCFMLEGRQILYKNLPQFIISIIEKSNLIITKI
jgi:hypothetical protein